MGERSAISMNLNISSSGMGDFSKDLSIFEFVVRLKNLGDEKKTQRSELVNDNLVRGGACVEAYHLISLLVDRTRTWMYGKYRGRHII